LVSRAGAAPFLRGLVKPLDGIGNLISRKCFLFPLFFPGGFRGVGGEDIDDEDDFHKKSTYWFGVPLGRTKEEFTERVGMGQKNLCFSCEKRH